MRRPPIIRNDQDWGHVWLRHYTESARRPNHGECTTCNRDAEYVAQYPNGTKAEYCRLHAWSETAFYLWDVTNDDVFDQTLEYDYVERLEYVGKAKPA